MATPPLTAPIHSMEPARRPALSKSLSTPAEGGPPPPALRRRPARPPLQRGTSIREAISTSACNYLGIGPGPHSGGTSPAATTGSTAGSTQDLSASKWAARRLRHCSRRYGGVKESARLGPTGTIPSTPMSAALTSPGLVSDFPDIGQVPPSRELAFPVDPLALGRQRFLPRGASVDASFFVGRSDSEQSRGSRVRVLQRRESVAKMAWDGLSSLVSKGTLRSAPSARRRTRQASHSFSPGSMGIDDASSSVFDASPNPPSTAATLNPSDLPMATIDEAANEDVVVRLAAEEDFEETELGKDFPDTIRRGSLTPPIGDVVKEIELKRSLGRRAAESPWPGLAETPMENDVFFDLPPTLPSHRPFFPPRGWAAPQPYLRSPDFPFPLQEPHQRHRHGIQRLPSDTIRAAPLGGPGSAAFSAGVPDRAELPPELLGPPEDQQRWLRNRMRKRQPPDARKKSSAAALLDETKSVWAKLFPNAREDGDRRRIGEGVVGRFFGRSLRGRAELTPHVQQQLDDFDDHRPYFTWWVTTVQILVTLISICLYGIGPIGFTRTQKTAMVLHTSVTLIQVPYYEQDNFWIGPRFADLVHLGAKYSPCMRRDQKLDSRVEAIRAAENTTSCCIYNDKTGCFQTNLCPPLIATALSWEDGSGPRGRRSGSVCGQDPRACARPTSVAPFEWPDDITRWPICEENVASTLPHMACEITGRPCCIGIQGECRITTDEYCRFVNGYFHEEAALCSQVSCMGEVCGMIPFIRSERPDQFYRLFISLFLHAGLIHVLFTAVVQYFLMRDLEKLIGWSRMALIYLVSGVAGNLASAIFVPYAAEVGPAGSQFAVLAALFADAIYSWRLIVRPGRALLQLSAITGSLFVVGLLPWVDNWAHSFGFLFGLLLSLALFPYIQFEESSGTKRLIIVVVCLASAVGVFAGLVVLFYVFPFWDCKACGYFNCIPLASHFCDNKGLQLDLLPF